MLHIIGSYLKLDEDGFLDEGAQIESAGYAISRLEAMTAGPVVGLDAKRELRELHKAHRWEPSPAQRRALTQAALGHPKATPNIPSVKITKEKHAAEKEAARLSWRARKAIDELRSAIGSLGFKIDCLDAEDMEGLETAVRKEAEEGESWVRTHWQAIARQIQYRAEVASALQTGSGEWYAVVEATKWDERRHGEQMFVEERKCASRDEAVAVARELLSSAVPRMEPGLTIEAKTIPALQWEEQGY